MIHKALLKAYLLHYHLTQDRPEWKKLTIVDACCLYAAAMPHLTIDPIVAASAVVTSLQHLVSRVTKATEGAVISVSRFNTGKTPGLQSCPGHASFVLRC